MSPATSEVPPTSTSRDPIGRQEDPGTTDIATAATLEVSALLERLSTQMTGLSAAEVLRRRAAVGSNACLLYTSPSPRD